MIIDVRTPNINCPKIFFYINHNFFFFLILRFNCVCFYEGHATKCSIILRALGIKGQHISMTSVNTLRVQNTEIHKKKKIVIRSFNFSKSISTYTLMNNKTKPITTIENYCRLRRYVYFQAMRNRPTPSLFNRILWLF